MVRESVLEKKLYNAASGGDLATLTHVLREDPYLLVLVSFACSRNLLHIATMHGQTTIVELLLDMNPQLARNVDSNKSSPLHIAAALELHEIAARLVAVAPEVCWWRDGQGMNPFHVAAMNGRIRTMELLIGVDPFPAKEKLDRGQNVLHLCLKHRKLAALVYLVENLNELVKVEDDDGEMLLHSAIRSKQVKVVRFLVEKHKTYELPTNSNGKTMHQISQENSGDAASIEIDRILSRRISYSSQSGGFRGKMSDVTMVVVVVIATMAFQASVSPPGGVWQEEGSSSPHEAGEAVMAISRPKIFKNFEGANNVAFFSSIITIFLLTTGLPSTNALFMMIAMCGMWVSLACISISYVSSMLVITPHREERTITHVIYNIVGVFLAMYAAFCVSSLFTLASRIRVYRMAREWRQQRAVGFRPQSWFASFCVILIALHAFCFHG